MRLRLKQALFASNSFRKWELKYPFLTPIECIVYQQGAISRYLLSFLNSSQVSLQQLHPEGGEGRGGMPPGSPNPDPISTKKCNFLHPFSDQTSKIQTIFQTRPLGGNYVIIS